MYTFLSHISYSLVTGNETLNEVPTPKASWLMTGMVSLGSKSSKIPGGKSTRGVDSEGVSLGGGGIVVLL